MTALDGADFVVLVTEPTPFGLHDLTLAVEAVNALGIPSGVVINRYDSNASDTEAFLKRKGIPVIGWIPDDLAVAKIYSEGQLVIDALPDYREAFSGIVTEFAKTRKKSCGGNSPIGQRPHVF